MIGWLIALVYNAVADFASALPGTSRAASSARCGGCFSNGRGRCMKLPRP